MIVKTVIAIIKISGKTGGRKNMQKVIEKAVIKITQEIYE